MPLNINTSVYKRLSSKELDVSMERDRDIENVGNFDYPEKGQNTTGNPQWWLSLPHVCVATISSFLFGYHTGVVNEPLETISIDLGFAGNTIAEGLVVSMCLGGAFFGCLFSGAVADKIGRRRAFQLSVLPMIIGASLSASTKSIEGMLIGRFLVGIGMGLGPPVTTLYVTEVSPSYVRGRYGSIVQIATCLGIVVALFIGIPVKEVPGWWRVCFWVAIAPAILQALFMECCAESPHWLYKCGRIGEAEVVFERLLGASHVKPAIAELARLEKPDDGEDVKYKDLFFGHNYKVVFIGTTLFALQQLSGINAVFYFSSTVFKRAGVPSDLANMCVGVTNLSGSVIAMLLMDKLGRRMLLSGSFISMALAMGLQAAAANLHDHYSWTLYLSLGGMLMFVLSFSLGAGPVPGLLLSEIFPNKIRAKAMALCMSVHWVFNFLVGLLFLRLLDLLGAAVLNMIFATFCMAAAIFVRKNVMETTGKTLQEIEVSLLQHE